MARGRKPLGKKAMTDAERQRRHRERKAYEAGAIKTEINRLTRAQIRQYRIAKIEKDLAMAEEAARLSYGWHPEWRNLKRLPTRLAELRRKAAEFRHRPSRYSTMALTWSDRRAYSCLHEQANEWIRLNGPSRPPSGWVPPIWIACAEEHDELVAQGLTEEEIERRANGETEEVRAARDRGQALLKEMKRQSVRSWLHDHRPHRLPLQAPAQEAEAEPGGARHAGDRHGQGAEAGQAAAARSGEA